MGFPTFFIDSESQLLSEDKETALEQVATLENELTNNQTRQLKPVKTAIAALNGVTVNLPKATVFVEQYNKLIPAISELFNNLFN